MNASDLTDGEFYLAIILLVVPVYMAVCYIAFKYFLDWWRGE